MVGFPTYLILGIYIAHVAANSSNKHGPELEVITWIIGKCAEKNIGFLESIQALETTGKCLEAQEPAYLKSMNSKTPEDHVRYKEAVAREVCKTWQKTNNCLKPIIEVLERCFDMKNGVILQGMEIFYREFCSNVVEVEGGLIELGAKMMSKWDSCVKSKQKNLISKINSCIAEKGDIHNYICSDYESAVDCVTTNLDKLCKEMKLGYALRHVLENRKLREYLRKELFECPSLKTEL